MAAYPLTVTPLDRAGIAPVAQNTTASVGGFTFAAADGRSWIEVTNLDTISHTVTFVTTGQSAGLEVADVPVTVPAGQTRMCGPFGAVFGFGDVTMTTDVSVNGLLGLKVYRLPVG